ncbi:mitochondrial phosphate carrier protein [Massarina eburnea CBS 473.64]|uniref:Mitochondrial phosphate carrier protein n=1 Tax=Massarina eburnea CBS 473.64 TaxID=1395130 RepID=A0A6A6RZN3_9PLEO|nr:mitochondrial phosphate carrier protein [Massarina eburnea CBS 473.64]
MSKGVRTVVNLGSGLLSGFVAVIVSQPANTMLSKINNTKNLPAHCLRLIKIANALGIRGSFAGLPTHLFMVGGLAPGQPAIYGNVNKTLGAINSVEIAK